MGAAPAGLELEIDRPGSVSAPGPDAQTGEFNLLGVTRVLEAVKQVDPKIRLYQASSSEMYGKVREVAVMMEVADAP
jgi:GDP-D-mannose dehydratase